MHICRQKFIYHKLAACKVNEFEKRPIENFVRCIDNFEISGQFGPLFNSDVGKFGPYFNLDFKSNANTCGT